MALAHTNGNDFAIGGEVRDEKRKSEGMHFTPTGLAEILARTLAGLLPRKAGTKIRVLDPSCGDGGLLAAFAENVGKVPVELIGVEQDAQAVEIAAKRLRGFAGTQVIQGDFLEIVGRASNVSLFESEEPKALLDDFDVVIANPPYVRTQVLGSSKSRLLAEQFGLSGRVDLFHPFFVAMSRCLRPGGILGAITSNRYLTTLSGKSTREFLATEFDVLEVVDLGDTKIFEAAVLPALFFGRRRGASDRSKESVATFARIYEDETTAVGRHVESVFHAIESREAGCVETGGRIFEVKTGTVTITAGCDKPWILATSGEGRWTREVVSGSRFVLSDLAKVRVGIKTTADSVFIRSDWDELPNDMRPEEAALKRLISHDEASRWRHAPDTVLRRVLYTHEYVSGKRRVIDFARYPGAMAYLNSNRERLESRKYVIDAGRKWFEIWVPQNPALWPQPKLVFPDISAEPKFFMDLDGCLVDGNCYWITPNAGIENDVLYLVMGLANTEFMTRFHDVAFQNKLYAGRRRYLTQYVEKYPVPNPDSPVSREIAAISRKLATQESSETELRVESERLEYLAPLAFGLQPPSGQ